MNYMFCKFSDLVLGLRAFDEIQCYIFEQVQYNFSYDSQPVLFSDQPIGEKLTRLCLIQLVVAISLIIGFNCELLNKFSGHDR